MKPVLLSLFEKGENYGDLELMKGKRIIVEFSSPNIAKPFHAGHLRSTMIGTSFALGFFAFHFMKEANLTLTGNFLKNLYKSLGATVTGINYLGDWGKQYGLLAIGFNKYGNEEELAKKPIKHLFDVYVKINEDKVKDKNTVDTEARAYFAKMESGDKEALKLWNRFREMSIKKYEQIYHRLNIQFDDFSGESLQTEGMGVAFDILREKKLIQSNAGAEIIDLKVYSIHCV